MALVHPIKLVSITSTTSVLAIIKSESHTPLVCFIYHMRDKTISKISKKRVFCFNRIVLQHIDMGFNEDTYLLLGQM